jgi:creatinine amidohydrolase
VDIDISVAIAEELCKEKQRILAPPFIYGIRSLPNSGGGSGLAGTIFLEGSTYTKYTANILAQYIWNEASRIMIINGHYENYAFLCEAAESLAYFRHCAIVVMNWWDLLDDAFMAEATAGRFSGWQLEHAGIVETSLEMYLKKELVKGIWFEEKSTAYQGLYSRGMPFQYSLTGALSPNLGASGDTGKKIFKQIVDRIGKFLTDAEMEGK